MKVKVQSTFGKWIIWKLGLLCIATMISLIALASTNIPFYQVSSLSLRLLVFIISLFVLLLLMKRSNYSSLPWNGFLIVLILGGVLALNKPVQLGLDEESHLKATLQMEDSPLFIYSKEETPDYTNTLKHDMIRFQAEFQGDDYWYNLTHKDEVSSGRIIGFENPSYWPGLIGWKIGEWISNKVVVSYYLGRLFTVFSYALLVLFALKLSKSYREMILVMSALPATLIMIAGYNYDYLYYGASLIILAILTNVFSGKSQFTARTVILYWLASLGLAFAKLPFVLLAFLPIVIPNQYFTTKWHKWLAGLLGLSALIAGYVRTIVFSSSNVTSATSGTGFTYFLRHPLPLVRTIIEAPSSVLGNFIGDPIKYIFQGRTPALINTMSILTFFLLIFILSIYYRHIQFSKWFKWICSGILFVIVVGIIVAISGDPRVYHAGDITVGGVQGRYYYFMVAMLPLVLRATYKYLPGISDISLEEEAVNRFVLYAVLFLAILVAASQLFIYW